MSFRIYTPSDLESSRPPAEQIEGMLSIGGLGVFYGAPEQFKTYLAIDLAFCTALGLDWHGHAVRQGRVIYVAAEGGHSTVKRTRAWQESRALTTNDVGFVKRPVNLLDEKVVEEFAASVDASGPAPVLFCFDTYNLCIGDADENASGTASGVIRACRRLSSHFGAAVTLIHHTGTKEERERGSSALRAGADLMAKITRVGSSLTVTVGGGPKFDKVRDYAPFEPFTRSLIVVGDSLAVAEDISLLSVEARILNELKKSDGQSSTALRVALARGKGTVDTALTALESRHAIHRVSGRWHRWTDTQTETQGLVTIPSREIGSEKGVTASGPVVDQPQSSTQSSSIDTGLDLGLSPPPYKGGAGVQRVAESATSPTTSSLAHIGDVIAATSTFATEQDHA